MASTLHIQANTEVLGFYQKQKAEFHFREKTDNEFLMFLLDTAVRVISIVQHLAPVIEAVSDANETCEELLEDDSFLNSGPTSPHPATMDVDTSEDDVRVLPHQVPHQVPQQVTQQVTQQVPPLVRSPQVQQQQASPSSQLVNQSGHRTALFNQTPTKTRSTSQALPSSETYTQPNTLQTSVQTPVQKMSTPVQQMSTPVQQMSTALQNKSNIQSNISTAPHTLPTVAAFPQKMPTSTSQYSTPQYSTHLPTSTVSLSMTDTPAAAHPSPAPQSSSQSTCSSDTRDSSHNQFPSAAPSQFPQSDLSQFPQTTSSSTVHSKTATSSSTQFKTAPVLSAQFETAHHGESSAVSLSPKSPPDHDDNYSLKSEIIPEVVTIKEEPMSSERGGGVSSSLLPQNTLDHLMNTIQSNEGNVGVANLVTTAQPSTFLASSNLGNMRPPCMVGGVVSGSNNEVAAAGSSNADLKSLGDFSGVLSNPKYDQLKTGISCLESLGRQNICQYCGKEISGCKYHLKRHIDSVHLKLKPYTCRFCRVSFAQDCRRKIHEKSVHADSFM